MPHLPTALRLRLRLRSSNPQNEENSTRQESNSTTPSLTTSLEPFTSDRVMPKKYWHKCDRCYSSPSFSMEALYIQHMENIHNITNVATSSGWACKMGACRRDDLVWARFEQYKHHMKVVHNVTDILQLWDNQVLVPTNGSQNGQSSGSRLQDTDSDLPTYQPSSSWQPYPGYVCPPPYQPQINSNPPDYDT